MTDKQKFDELAGRIKKQYPHSEIRYKEDYWYWRILPKKLRHSGITLNNTIWMPFHDNNYEMLAHEYQHLVDWNDIGVLNFLMMYTCPQILSVFWFFFALMAVIFGLKIFAIITACIGVLFLLPWPSKGRVYLEMKGYLMTLYVAALENKDMYGYRNFVVDALKSWLYYKMVWTSRHASNLVFEAEEVLNDQEAIANTSVAFQDVNEILTE